MLFSTFAFIDMTPLHRLLVQTPIIWSKICKMLFSQTQLIAFFKIRKTQLLKLNGMQLSLISILLVKRLIINTKTLKLRTAMKSFLKKQKCRCKNASHLKKIFWFGCGISIKFLNLNILKLYVNHLKRFLIMRQAPSYLIYTCSLWKLEFGTLFTLNVLISKIQN